MRFRFLVGEPQLVNERISERSGVSLSAASSTSSGVSAGSTTVEYFANFGRGIFAGIGSGAENALLLLLEKVFFRLTISLSAFFVEPFEEEDDGVEGSAVTSFF